MSPSRRRARALTLIELTVVLLILAATAGILVPRMVGYGERAHGATSAASIQEGTKALALYEVENGVFPDGWDNLIDDGGGLPSSLFESGTLAFNVLSAGALTAAEADALAAAGITTVYGMDTDHPDFDATFNPYGAAPTPTVLAGTTPVAVLDPAVLRRPAGSRIVVFGMGRQCTLFGDSAHNVPLVFEGGMSPSDIYLRYGVAFEVGDAGGAYDKARFLGVVKCEPADGNVVGADEHLAVYYGSLRQ